eukprot:PhF_6_TR13236/c0_g1_i2/m.20966
MNEIFSQALTQSFHGESLSRAASVLTALHAMVAETTPHCNTGNAGAFSDLVIFSMKSIMSVKHAELRGLQKQKDNAQAMYRMDVVERSLSSVVGGAILMAFYCYGVLPRAPEEREVVYHKGVRLAQSNGVCLPDTSSIQSILSELFVEPRECVDVGLPMLCQNAVTYVMCIVKLLWPMKRIPWVWDPQGAFRDWLQHEFNSVMFNYEESVRELEHFCSCLCRIGETDTTIVLTDVPSVLNSYVCDTLFDVVSFRLGKFGKTKIVLVYKDTLECPEMHRTDTLHFAFVDAGLDMSSAIQASSVKLAKILIPKAHKEWMDHCRCSGHQEISDIYAVQSQKLFKDMLQDVYVSACTMHVTASLLTSTVKNTNTYLQWIHHVVKSFDARLPEMRADYYWQPLEQLRLKEESGADEEEGIDGDIISEDGTIQHYRHTEVGLASGILCVMLEPTVSTPILAQVVVASTQGLKSQPASPQLQAVDAALKLHAIEVFRKQNRLRNELAIAQEFKTTLTMLVSRKSVLRIADPPDKSTYLESRSLFRQMTENTDYERQVEEFLCVCVLASTTEYHAALPSAEPCVDRAIMEHYYADVITKWSELQQTIRDYKLVQCGHHGSC